MANLAQSQLFAVTRYPPRYQRAEVLAPNGPAENRLNAAATSRRIGLAMRTLFEALFRPILVRR
jgi:hypothetical protein